MIYLFRARARNSEMNPRGVFKPRDLAQEKIFREAFRNDLLSRSRRLADLFAALFPHFNFLVCFAS